MKNWIGTIVFYECFGTGLLKLDGIIVKEH